MFRDVVTVFNFHKPSGLWYTTVFKNCDLSETKSGKNTADSGTVNEDAVTLLINVEQDKTAHTLIYEPHRIVDSTGRGLLSGDGQMLSYRDPDTDEVRKYVGPKAYGRLDDPSGFFTFQPETDFLVAGNLSSADPIPDDGYDGGYDEGLYHAMNEEQDEVYMITSAAFYGLIPHFEIGGK